MKFLRLMTIVWLVMGQLCGLRAHQVETVEFEFQKLESQWRLLGEMDIAYMLPETRGIPGGQPLSREGVMKSPPEELARIRRETEKTLRSLLRITFADQDVPWRIEFPDFDKQPFALPEEAADWALLTTRLVVDIQPGAGELVVHWSGQEESELIILTEDSEEGEIVSVPPGGKIALVRKEATGEAVQPEQDAGGGWLASGYKHVLPYGFDHILFILGLFLLVPQWKPLMTQSLLFTLAHSITLALAVFGFLPVSARLVEILVAFSIAFIGVENLLTKKAGPLRYSLVFAFGLVHGMGFARGMLDKVKSLPGGQLAGAVLGFNVGVELAQITVIVAAFLLILPLTKWRLQVRTYGSVFIALAGIGWTIERIYYALRPPL